jgi:hypothetical protein
MIFGYIRKRNNVKYKLELDTNGEEQVIAIKDTFAQAVDEDMDGAFFDPPLSLPEVPEEDDEDYSTTSNSRSGSSSVAFYVKSKKKLNVKNARVRSSRRIKRL